MSQYKELKKKTNRKQIKARYIKAKNSMRKYPECVIDKDIYCDHLYDAKSPWCWVDFRFFHSTLRRYFAVAMITAEFKAWEEVDDATFIKADYPDGEWDKCNFEELPHPKYGKVFRHRPSSDFSKKVEEFRERKAALDAVEMIKPRAVECGFTLEDYDDGVVGVKAVVNTTHIDEQYLKDFVKMFRALGEPMQPGKYNVETIQVVPDNINKRRTKDA
jgi:hypothetical protein